MKKKFAAALTAGALALSAVTAAPEANAEQTVNFTAPVATTPADQSAPNYVSNGTNNTNKATAAANANQSLSSEIGTKIFLLVFGVLILAFYGWMSPYNPNGAWANATQH